MFSFLNVHFKPKRTLAMEIVGIGFYVIQMVLIVVLPVVFSKTEFLEFVKIFGTMWGLFAVPMFVITYKQGDQERMTLAWRVATASLGFISIPFFFTKVGVEFLFTAPGGEK